MDMEVVTLSDGEFKQMREIVYGATGISLSDSKKALIVSRLARRLRELQIHSFMKYIDRLRSDTNEVLLMINRITTNLTRFYREKKQFDVLKEKVLPEILQTAKSGERKRIRIWSAGCSTGEEVYTILFEMMDFFSRRVPATVDLKILGSDIDTNVLKKARNGCYTAEEVKGVTPSILETYFDALSDVEYKVKQRFRQYVLFSKNNLVYEPFTFKNKIDI
ncbi:MAG: protein-glutamate O-methyltransferase CheR, partial [bacterium]|nr:protein-glutamate O-methyltransferase CheR [bacterium]